MRNKILRQSLFEIAEDPKLVRLATITTFIHSLLFIVYILYVIITLSEQAGLAKTGLGDIVGDFTQLIDGSTTTIVILIILGICLAIGWTILPPIGDGAMINYVSSEQKSGTTSLGSGFTRFFPMMEFNATLGFINLVSRGFATSRLYVLCILNNGLTIGLIICWLIIILMAMVFLPYTKMVITLEQKDYFEAMKESSSLAIHNLGTTIKFALINLFLYIRFIINILIVVGIPLGLLYLASEFGIIDNDITQGFIITILIALIALTAYINGIIEAFFVTYRYKVYIKITTGEEPEETIPEEKSENHML